MYNQNQLARDIKLVSRIKVLVGGQLASDHDHRQFQSTALMRFGLELDLLGRSMNEACAFRRALGAIDCIELCDYFADFKVVKLNYLNFIQENPGGTWQHFKRAVAGNVRNKWILGTAREFFSNAAAMLQWLSFDERLLLDSLNSTESEISDYVEHENKLGLQVLPEDICVQLRGIISEWMKDCCPSSDVPKPKFGPGSTSDIKGRIPALWKVCGMAPDPSTVVKLCDIYACNPEDLFPETSETAFGTGIGNRTNTILFVPKNATKHRIISKEPIWLSWLQQAIKRQLYDYVETHPKMYTWFENQNTSREFALLGSVDGRYATYDFSAASDSITLAMVESLFQDTYWATLLIETRSTHAKLPDGQILCLHKFAPMGSATCFGTMDIILLSICELSVRTTLYRVARFGDYVVYGDDVIIRADCADAFKRISTAMGLRPNLDKTYWRTDTPKYYRESCGIEAYDGMDITPLRYSRKQEPLLKYKETRRVMHQCDTGDIDWYSSVCSLINKLQLRGYQYTRSICVQLIKLTASDTHTSRIWYGLPRIDETDYRQGKDIPLSVVVPDGTATNYRVKRKRDNDLQIQGPVCYQPATVPEDWHDELDDIAYSLWFFAAQTDDGDPEDEILRGSAGIRSRKWVKRIVT